MHVRTPGIRGPLPVARRTRRGAVEAPQGRSVRSTGSPSSPTTSTGTTLATTGRSARKAAAESNRASCLQRDDRRAAASAPHPRRAGRAGRAARTQALRSDSVVVPVASWSAGIAGGEDPGVVAPRLELRCDPVGAATQVGDRQPHPALLLDLAHRRRRERRRRRQRRPPSPRPAPPARASTPEARGRPGRPRPRGRPPSTARTPSSPPATARRPPARTTPSRTSITVAAARGTAATRSRRREPLGGPRREPRVARDRVIDAARPHGIRHVSRARAR